MQDVCERDLYEFYRAFQSRLCEYAALTCQSDSAREHYCRVFRPVSVDEFRTDLAGLPDRLRRARVSVWTGGFDCWLQTESRQSEVDSSRGTEFDDPEGVMPVVRELGARYRRLPPLEAEGASQPAVPREV